MKALAEQVKLRVLCSVISIPHGARSPTETVSSHAGLELAQSTLSEQGWCHGRLLRGGQSELVNDRYMDFIKRETPGRLTANSQSLFFFK